jgi:hypothetical protein
MRVIENGKEKSSMKRKIEYKMIFVSYQSKIASLAPPCQFEDMR